MEPAEGATGFEATAPPRQAWLILPALIAFAMIVLDLTTDTDRLVTRLFYDTRAGAFPLRYTFWLEVVMHQWAKYAVVTLGCHAIAGLLLSFVLPALRAQRRTLLFIVLALSFAPLSVAVGKALSSKHCPWSVDEFGGLVPYARIFESPAPNIPPGRCFPAGHASTGFALLAFYFAAYARRMRRAGRAALTIGITAGGVLGFGRVLQGAHFASHVIWSGIFCWLVMVLLYLLVLRNGSAIAGQRSQSGGLRSVSACQRVEVVFMSVPRAISIISCIRCTPRPTPRQRSATTTGNSQDSLSAAVT